MRNEVKINKNTGEVYLFAQASREQRAVMIKSIEGVVSFPIKVEEIKGNKDAITVHTLYYQDSLMGEDVRLLTFDERDEALATRKELERAYRRHSGASVAISLGVPIVLVLCAFFAGRHFPANDVISLPGVNYSQQGAASISADPTTKSQAVDADMLEKLTQQYEKELVDKKAKTEEGNKTDENKALLSSQEEVKLSNSKEAQQMMDALNGKGEVKESPESPSETLSDMLNGQSKK